jgi:8-oxo-dGTP diphosphatase
MTSQDFDFSAWRPEVVATLVYIIDRDRMFLIRKRRGHGRGKINGPGGKVERGETPVACAVRECQEETGLTPLDLEPLVELRFLDVGDDGEPPMLGLAFRAVAFEGVARQTAEAEPFWCSLDAIPYDRMWADDRVWLPHLIANEPVRGDFVMAGERLVDHRLCPVGRPYLRELAARPV